MKANKAVLAMAVSSIALGVSNASNADSFADALTSGKANGDIRLRYESVEDDNAADDASALTMRTRIGYSTGTFGGGFSIVSEFEDVRVVGEIDDYELPSTPVADREFSVIADPEMTELEQGYVKYATGGFTAKVGRQVFTLDNHRFVGHVGWRQDRQTFDAVNLNYKTGDLDITVAYLDQREGIIGQAADIDSEDTILNVSYKTSVGTVTGYGYLLDEADSVDMGVDTMGIRFAGAKDKLSYTAEFATQDTDTDAEATYMNFEGGYDLGFVKLGLGYEVLGSDDGGYGFQTPLATKHKFNGWADKFLTTPATGLVDLSFSISGKAGPGNYSVIYHDFSSDESDTVVNETPVTIDDLGSEIDLVYSMKFGKIYNGGVKAAIYSKGDAGFDTTKYWLWVGATF